MNRSVCVAIPEGAYRDRVIYQLEHLGAKITAIHRGIDLLNRIRFGAFHHLFIKTDLPDYDALELVLYVRDVDKNIPITVIGDRGDSLRHKILMAGATHWIEAQAIDAFMHRYYDSGSQVCFKQEQDILQRRKK